MKRLRGFVHLAFDMVDKTTNLVERTCDGCVDRSIRRFAAGESATSPAPGLMAMERAVALHVFRSIRAINEMTRLAVDAGSELAERRLQSSAKAEVLALATPLQSTAAGSASWVVDHLQSAANAFCGDYLVRQRNPLDLGMSIRHHGRPLPLTRECLAEAFPRAGPKVCILVHGLSLTEWIWSRSSEKHYGEAGVTFGSRLEADLGHTPIYVRYNTGVRIAENGRALSALLTELIDVYPSAIEEICIVGYSMGGLVARSAAQVAHQHRAPWIGRLRQVVCVGSPHDGSPLAQAADVLAGILRNIDAAAPQVLAELLDARSEGIRDLEQGTMVDREQAAEEMDQILEEARCAEPLVDGVRYTFVAATVTRDPAHPLGYLLGDLFVRLSSASGNHPSEPARRIPFQRGKVIHGLHHFDLTSHPEVYEAIRDQIRDEGNATETPAGPARPGRSPSGWQPADRSA